MSNIKSTSKAKESIVNDLKKQLDSQNLPPQLVLIDSLVGNLTGKMSTVQQATATEPTPSLC